MCILLESLFAHQQVAPRKNGYHGPAFPYTRGTTQGGLVSHTLFKVVMENVIHTWLEMAVEDQRVAHTRMEEAVGRCLGIFYADDGMVVSRYPEWLQHLMHILVSPFRRYGLAANVAKSRLMM